MRNKYNNIRTEYEGRSFASKGERDCYLMLKLLERAGKIKDIQCQVVTRLTAGITHRTDFKCWDIEADRPLWVEYKGFEDQRWRDIRKLWRHFGPGCLKVYKGYGSRMKLTEVIIPQAKLEIEGLE